MKWSEKQHTSYEPANYCRSPSQDSNHSGPWCYINKPPWWEFCFVPRCSKYIICLFYKKPEERHNGEKKKQLRNNQYLQISTQTTINRDLLT